MPDGRVEVFLSAALGGEYFPEDYRGKLSRSELESAGPTARLLLPRRRLEPSVREERLTPEPGATEFVLSSRDPGCATELAPGRMSVLLPEGEPGWFSADSPARFVVASFGASPWI
jgi:hypothetical protein